MTAEPCNAGAPHGFAVGTCSTTPRCKSCDEPLPLAPRSESSNWGDWRCDRCDAAHCQDGEPDDVCGLLLNDNEQCPIYISERDAREAEQDRAERDAK